MIDKWKQALTENKEILTAGDINLNYEYWDELIDQCTILDASKDTVHLKIFLFHINLLNFIHILLKFPRKTLDADIFI